MIQGYQDHEDVLVWPDGIWCYRHELSEMNHKSDDYVVLSFDSEEWILFLTIYEDCRKD